jgi:hypothetical protein
MREAAPVDIDLDRGCVRVIEAEILETEIIFDVAGYC